MSNNFVHAMNDATTTPNRQAITTNKTKTKNMVQPYNHLVTGYDGFAE